LPVPVAQKVLESVIKACGWVRNNYSLQINKFVVDGQITLLEKEAKYGKIAKAKKHRKIQTSISAQ